MKKFISFISILLILLVIVVIGLISYKYISPPKTVIDISSVNINKIDKIALFSGETGKQIEILDKEEIKQILELLDSAKYKYEPSERRSGFTLQITFYSKDKKIGSVGFKSENNVNINRNPYIGTYIDKLLDNIKCNTYTKTSGGIDINKLLNYIK